MYCLKEGIKYYYTFLFNYFGGFIIEDIFGRDISVNVYDLIVMEDVTGNFF